tara:strand:+ start:770 stop:1045 length:276 start_codon:yes stop_codon:yes gene_type:complete
MVVETKHGEFEVNNITRKQRRDHYKKVKTVFANQVPEELHDLADEFTLLAFGDEKKAEKKLKGLSALEEDEVLTAIIIAYMGLETGNSTGD